MVSQAAILYMDTIWTHKSSTGTPMNPRVSRQACARSRKVSTQTLPQAHRTGLVINWEAWRHWQAHLPCQPQYGPSLGSQEGRVSVRRRCICQPAFGACLKPLDITGMQPWGSSRSQRQPMIILCIMRRWRASCVQAYCSKDLKIYKHVNASMA